jgi:hypothetical protein
MKEYLYSSQIEEIVPNTFDSQIITSAKRETLLPIDNTKISKHIHITEKSVILYFRKFSDIIDIIIPSAFGSPSARLRLAFGSPSARLRRLINIQ